MSAASDRPAPPASRRTIASYSSYREAERAVDWLSDEDFAVEHVAIVGTGLRLVEQVGGRITTGRAAGIGALQGVLIGLLFALFFGLLFTGPGFGWLLLYAAHRPGQQARGYGTDDDGDPAERERRGRSRRHG